MIEYKIKIKRTSLNPNELITLNTKPLKQSETFKIFTLELEQLSRIERK